MTRRDSKKHGLYQAACLAVASAKAGGAQEDPILATRQISRGGGSMGTSPTQTIHGTIRRLIAASTCRGEQEDGTHAK
jgi:hypothetical protein